ncbi:hypothetical protein [Aurantiacibacter gangjinensis]|uniref:Uncharacterized protein n=1 Tax=Aurantiacibacter gangjinensis TaxID=502682 RepID=A0A0G9MVW6_9SPHN|nr:hypothetical protein [Aurantiacibacter gangjinensis]KLE33423.1 hypothetical protein AAW01_05720 [Aurantiacibacter gangjinensis]
MTGTAHAQDRPDPAICERLQAERGLPMAEPVSLEIPASFSDRAVQTGRWLATLNANGGTDCTFLGWVITAEPLEALSDRFIGFAWTGYVTYGYTLIDTGAGRMTIDTGSRPVFSPRGDRLAFVEVSDVRIAFKGFAVYQIGDGSFTPLHVDTFLPYHADWRVDEWANEDCILLSAVPRSRINNDYSRLPDAERDRYVAGRQNGWRLSPGTQCPDYP